MRTEKCSCGNDIFPFERGWVHAGLWRGPCSKAEPMLWANIFQRTTMSLEEASEAVRRVNRLYGTWADAIRKAAGSLSENRARPGDEL